jgi:hypothetical protein
VSIRFESMQGFSVKRRAFALHKHGFVGCHAECGERGEDVARGAGDFAFAVEILDAHQPLSTCRAREQPAAERGDERAEMQPSRRGGAKRPR